jgi:hypothetical protein
VKARWGFTLPYDGVSLADHRPFVERADRRATQRRAVTASLAKVRDSGRLAAATIEAMDPR